ncbi:MAG: hypothetical protein JSW03_00155 [Candidatus Eiseniibacteriota bacterium]|nr:MAG: hypothetical protein JSW03_00155 [Candidatus Eisenbacteria bacterium]
MKSLSFTLILAALLVAPGPAPASEHALVPSTGMSLEARDPLSFALSEASPFGASNADVSDAVSSGGEGSGPSRVKAMALSVLLPGAGHYYAGKKGRANIFFLTESAIWTSFVVFEVQGYLRKGNYREYAELMAGVDAEGKPDEFYRALGQYMRSDPGPGSYNESIRREARALYPDDREMQEQYLLENGYFGEDAWEWVSEEDQARYKSLRRKSQLSFRRATYMLGLAVANRILAAMDAARSVAGPAESPGEPLGLRFELRPHPERPSDVVVCLSKSF